MAAVKGYTGNDNGAQDLVGRAVQETNRMLGVDESLQQIASLLQDVESLLSDVNREVSDYVESMTFSEEEFYETEQRLNLLNRMKAKYGSTVEEILACQEEKQKDLDRLYHFEQYKEKLEKEMQITIFDRTNKGIHVSREGEIFLGYARQVLEQAALIEE